MPMKVTLTTAAFALVASVGSADPLNCVLTACKAVPGLTAAVTGQALAVTWDGDDGAELRLRFGIERGTPTIQDLAVGRIPTAASRPTGSTRCSATTPMG